MGGLGALMSGVALPRIYVQGMTRGYSTPCARELGYEMRLRRQRIGLNAVDLSRIVGWSESKISRAELGMYRVSAVEVGALPRGLRCAA